MIGCVQLDIGSKLYAAPPILSYQLEYFLDLDVVADENNVLSTH